MEKLHWSLTEDFHRDSWDTFCSTAVSSSALEVCLCFSGTPTFPHWMYLWDIFSDSTSAISYSTYSWGQLQSLETLSLSLHMNFLAEMIWDLLKDCLTSVALPDSNLKRANSIAKGLCKEWNNELYAKTGTEAYENSSCPMHITLSHPHLHTYFIAQ